MSMMLLAILGALAIDPPGTGEGEGATDPATAEAPATDLANSGVSPETALLDSLRSGGVGALRSLWSDLTITSDLFSGQPDTDGLEVQRFSMEFDGIAGDELLLVITDAAGSDYQFLALKESEGDWSRVGVIDIRNQRSDPPQHRIETLGETQRWLVIRALKSSGNGFSRVHETWYAAGQSLQNVLTYPIEGHVEGHDMPFNRTFHGTGRGIASVDDKPAVDIDLSVSYTNGEQFAIEGLGELFTRSAAVRYVLDAAAGRFVLDGDNSGMNEAEIEGIFGDDAEGFLRHNFTQLKELAQNGGDLKREWLRKFLDDREESSEKSVLAGLLGPDEAVGGLAADHSAQP